MGLVEFDALLGLQEMQIYELSGRDDLSGSLFLCEHPPTISMGREASTSDLRVDEAELSQQSIPVRWVSRGGGAFVHGPGQLAIYLQLPLSRLGIGLARFRESFELAVQQACREVKIPAKRDSGHPGLWSRNGQLAYFGAGVKSWVSWQGMFLNVSIDPRLLALTEATPEAGRSTSMQSQRLDPVRMPKIREAVVRALAVNFGYDMVDVATGHPLLTRSRQPAAVKSPTR